MTKAEHAQMIYDEGMARVANTPEPEGQKFPIGSRVRIGKMPSYMAHFRSDCNATVLYTYAHAYGSGDITSYCLDVDGRGVVAWYEEEQLTALNKLD